LKTFKSLSAILFIDLPLLTLNKAFDSCFLGDLSFIFFEYPKKYKLNFFSHHIINPMADFSKLPELKTTPHKFIQIFQLDILLISDNLFQQVHKLRLLQFMLFSIQHFFDMFVLL